MSSPDTTTPAPVTVIGLGLMGQALAAAFVAAGHPTTVWNRTPAKAASVTGQGARLAGSAQAAIEAGPLVVVVCVADYDALHELLDPLAPSLAGRVLVNLCTGTSTQARATAAWAARHDIVYLEGVIMAIPPDIASDAAILLYSGPRPVFDAHEATLRAIAPAGTMHLGDDHGLSPLYDMALLNFLWGTLNAFLHGAALLGTADVKATTFAELANRMIVVTTDYVSAYAGQVDDGDYPGTDASMVTHQHGLQHLVDESRHLGVNAEIPELFKALTDRAVDAGHGASSYAAMIEVFREASA